MRKKYALIICIILVFSYLVSAIADTIVYQKPEKSKTENDTVIEHASVFTNIYATKFTDTEEHRQETLAIIIRYAQVNSDDVLCKEFSEILKEHWGTMKCSIGAYKKGTTYATIAFENNVFYHFTVVHFPQTLLLGSKDNKTYDEAIIEMEKVDTIDDIYEIYEIVMKGLGEDRENMSFYKVTAYEFMSAYVKLFLPYD